MAKKQTISINDAEQKLIDTLNATDFGDRVYEFAISLYHKGIKEINNKYNITDVDGNACKDTDDEQWYDGVYEEFLEKVYEKTIDFLTGRF